jgi:alpha-aminoadipate carrier protein LysW
VFIARYLHAPNGTLKLYLVTNRSQHLKDAWNTQMTFLNKTISDEQKMIEQINQPKEVATIYKSKCPDCDAELDVPSNVEEGEILSCPGCGLELEVKQVKDGCINLQELTIEGEDWGE